MSINRDDVHRMFSFPRFRERQDFPRRLSSPGKEQCDMVVDEEKVFIYSVG